MSLLFFNNLFEFTLEWNCMGQLSRREWFNLIIPHKTHLPKTERGTVFFSPRRIFKLLDFSFTDSLVSIFFIFLPIYSRGDQYYCQTKNNHNNFNILFLNWWQLRVLSKCLQAPFLISDFFMAYPKYKTFVLYVLITPAANLFPFKSASFKHSLHFSS